MKTTVTFRGEEREVEFQVEDDPSVNAFSIEWFFPDMTGDEHTALGITYEEEEAISDACAEAYYDYDPFDY